MAALARVMLPALLQGKLQKSRKSTGESRAASGEGPAERLGGGGGEHPYSQLQLPRVCRSCLGRETG